MCYFTFDNEADLNQFVDKYQDFKIYDSKDKTDQKGHEDGYKKSHQLHVIVAPNQDFGGELWSSEIQEKDVNDQLISETMDNLTDLDEFQAFLRAD